MVVVRQLSELQGYMNRGHKDLICDSFVQDAQNLEMVLRAVRSYKLVSLKFFDCSLGPNSTAILFHQLKDMEHLTTLGLFSPSWPSLKIQEEVALAIGSFVKENSSLVKLCLSHCGLTKTSFLAEALRVNIALKTLDLSDNPISDKGIEGLVEGLIGNVCLEVLRLRNSGETFGALLGDVTAISLARMLRSNSSLTHLNLHGQEVQRVGGIALAQSLLENKALRELDLSHNLLDDEVATAFAELIQTTCNLRILLIHENNIHAEGIIQLHQALKANTLLETLAVLARTDKGTQLSQEDIVNSNLISRLLRRRKRERENLRLEAFKLAQGCEATTPWLRSKLMVVGRGAAGKTNTIRSLLGLKFNPDWDSTVGIDLTEVTTTATAWWKKVQHKDFARNFVNRLAVDSIAESPSLRNLKSKIKEKTREIQQNQEADTKSSAMDTPGQNSETKVEAEEPLFQYKEQLFLEQTDSKDWIRMSLWDYGGQTVFYTLHHLFLTQYGVYLIVFNMPKLLDDVEASSEYIRFWLNSIKLHAPNAPVLLVGTFLDTLFLGGQVSEQIIQSKLQQISTVIDEFCDGFDQVCSFEAMSYCPISNKSRTGIETLRSAVERETKEAPFVQTQVSLNWMRALDLLNEASDKAWVEVGQLKAELKEINIKHMDEIENMLRLFHELGVVLYFSSSVQLREVVISKPEWLLRMLSSVIRDKDVHDYDTAKCHEIQLTADLERYLIDGIASRDLLEFLWDGEQVDYLLELMHHLLLLSDWSFGSGEKTEQYLIPSMLPFVSTSLEITGVQFKFVFEFLPQGVFERVCCLCVGYSSTLPDVDSPKLYRTECLVDLGSKGLMKVVVNGSNDIVVTVSKEDQASNLLHFFLAILRRIQHDFMHSGLQWAVMVAIDKGFIQYEAAKTQMLQPWVKEKEDSDSAIIHELLEL